MNHSHFEFDRLEELLAGYTLGDLTPEEEVELETLREKSPEAKELAMEFDQTLARTQLAYVREVESIPQSLADRIEADAASYIAAVRPVRLEKFEKLSKSGFGAREGLAWIACVAALLLAFGLWQSNLDRAVPEISLADLRQNLVDSSGVIRTEWSDGKTPFETSVAGDVVWSNREQDGVMRFVGMPVNDPTIEQYQLWIIDPLRDDEPIDGGVFDVASDGEVLVRVRAKLEVLDPQAFAITVEKPGGVVVSTQERLPLLAAVQKSNN